MRRKRRLSTANVNVFAGVAGGAGAKTNHARVMRRRDYPKRVAECQIVTTVPDTLTLTPIYLLLTRSFRDVFDMWSAWNG
jgi:hypothetical protein